MKKILYSALLIGALGFHSCSDVLDVTPTDIIDETKAFQSLADLEQGLTGVYAAVSGANLIELSTRMGDNLRRSGENRGQGVQMHNWTFATNQGEVEGVWANMYLVITRANRVLAATERLQNEGVVNEASTAAIRAQLLALRAMSHFDIWRLYSQKYDPQALAAPYLTLEDTDNNGRPDGLDIYNQPARLTTADYFIKLNNDLTAATALMPASFTDKSRMNVTAIAALRARVSLYQENWAAAINFATQALEQVPLETSADFLKIWKDESNNGVIFKLRRVSGEFAVGTLFQDQNGDVFFHPSNTLISTFDPAKDVRYSATIKIESRGSRDPQLVNKYPGITGLPKLNDIKVFRSSEMLLIRAEAFAKSNQLAAGVEDLNTLRSNRIEDYIDQSYSSLAEFMSEILIERRRELAFEGHRWFDLKRNGLGVDRPANDCHLNCTLEAGSFRFTLPIPQSEIFANPNMVQNSNYNQ